MSRINQYLGGEAYQNLSIVIPYHFARQIKPTTQEETFMEKQEMGQNCPAIGGIGTLHNRLVRLEELLIDGLSTDISEHLDSYVLRLRKLRSVHFPSGYFADVMWDILLELSEAHRTGRDMSVSDLGLQAGVPSTTAQRYLSMLEQDGFVFRRNDKSDSRRSFVYLSDAGVARMEALLKGFVETVNEDLEKARLKSRLRLVA